MSTQISILFHGRKPSITRNNLLPVYFRITIEGKRIEQFTRKYVEPSKWCTKSGKMKGHHSQAKVFDSYLDALRSKIYTTEQEILRNGEKVNF